MAPKNKENGLSEEIANNPKQLSLSEFKSLVGQDSLLGVYSIEDDLLLKFLRARDYKTKEALNLLHAYVSMIQQHPELFTWSNSLRKVLDAKIHRICRSRRLDGGVIGIIAVKNWDPNQLDPKEVFQLIITADEAEVMDPEIQEKGFHTVIDASGVTLSQIYRFGVSNGRLISELGDKILPVNVRKIHIIFENRLVDIGYNLFKPFLSEEFKQRIIFHGKNIDSLKECCPLSALPPEFGGTCNDDYTTDQRLERFEKHRTAIEKIWNKFKLPKKNQDKSISVME